MALNESAEKNIQNLDVINKTRDWLRQIIDASLDETDVKQRLNREVSRTIEKKVQLFTLPKCIKNKHPPTQPKVAEKNVRQINEEVPSAESAVGIDKWTLVKQSTDLLIKGHLVSLKNKEIIIEDFLSGVVLKRLSSDKIETRMGKYFLVGKLQDEDNEIPVEVKKHFAKAFPDNWKYIINRYWIDSAKEENPQRSKRGCTRKEKAVTEMENDDTMETMNSSSNSTSILISSSSFIEETSSTNSPNEKTERNEAKSSKSRNCKADEKYLKHWTLVKNVNDIILKGYLFDPATEDLATDLFCAGSVKSRKQHIKIETDSGVYLLAGTFDDPDNIIPDVIKSKFEFGFPKNWQSIIDADWRVVNDDAREVQDRGKKKASSISKKSTTSKVRKVVDEDKEAKNRRKTKSNIAVKAPISKKSSVKGNGKMPKNSKKTRGILTEKGNVETDESDFLEDCSPKISTKKTNVAINKKKNTAASGKRKLAKNVATNKAKRSKMSKEDTFFGMDSIGLPPNNQTNDFFKSFDKDCFDKGVPINSFKEISVGDNTKNLSKGGSYIVESPNTQNMFKFCGISMTSNHSIHSAPNSPVEKRTDVAKRVQKLNKGKKNEKTGKRTSAIGKKGRANAKVNAVFKEAIKKNTVSCGTPKIIKKVFRVKAHSNVDDSMPVDSSENESDFEEVF